jgi:hypothetical protein
MPGDYLNLYHGHVIQYLSLFIIHLSLFHWMLHTETLMLLSDKQQTATRSNLFMTEKASVNLQ